MRTAVGPLILAMPALGTVLSALVCVYVLYLACRPYGVIAMFRGQKRAW
jgi:hypothetical protein